MIELTPILGQLMRSAIRLINATRMLAENQGMNVLFFDTLIFV